MNKFIYFIVGTVLFLTACSMEENNKENTYDTTKKMVLDIIQTDEGKKSIRDVMRADDMRKMLIMDADETKLAIEQTLSSEKSTDMWKKLFEDPTFVEVFYKSVEDEHKKFMEKILSDPLIQKKVMELMQDPEMMKEFEKLMKSASYKEHLQKVMEEAYETPTFQKRTYDIMKKIVDEKDKGQKEKSSKKSGQEEETPDEEGM